MFFISVSPGAGLLRPGDRLPAKLHHYICSPVSDAVFKVRRFYKLITCGTFAEDLFFTTMVPCILPDRMTGDVLWIGDMQNTLQHQEITDEYAFQGSTCSGDRCRSRICCRRLGKRRSGQGLAVRRLGEELAVPHSDSGREEGRNRQGSRRRDQGDRQEGDQEEGRRKVLQGQGEILQGQGEVLQGQGEILQGQGEILQG